MNRDTPCPFPPAYRELFHTRLTDREREVCELLSCGLTAVDVAHSLCISASTVRTHIRSIGKKLPGDGPPQRKAVRAFAAARGARA